LESKQFEVQPCLSLDERNMTIVANRRTVVRFERTGKISSWSLNIQTTYRLLS